MSNLPGFLLRNCTLWADRQSKLGQIGDITVPVAAPRRYSGMMSPMMENTTAPITPPKAPATARAASSMG